MCLRGFSQFPYDYFLFKIKSTEHSKEIQYNPLWQDSFLPPPLTLFSIHEQFPLGKVPGNIDSDNKLYSLLNICFRRPHQCYRLTTTYKWIPPYKLSSHMGTWESLVWNEKALLLEHRKTLSPCWEVWNLFERTKVEVMLAHLATAILFPKKNKTGIFISVSLNPYQPGYKNNEL